jgi:hypothetical protein
MPDAGLISQLAMPLNSVLIGVNRSVQPLFYRRLPSHQRGHSIAVVVCKIAQAPPRESTP